MKRNLRRFLKWITPVLIVAAASLISALIVWYFALSAFWAVLTAPVLFAGIRQGVKEFVETKDY